MSRQQQTRSTLEIGAVAQAAAGGLPKMLPPIVKPRIIAALAGFVLRLFRDRMTADQAAAVRGRAGKLPGAPRGGTRKRPELASKVPARCTEPALNLTSTMPGADSRPSDRNGRAVTGNSKHGGTRHG